MHSVLASLEENLRQVASAVQNSTSEDRTASVIHGNALTPSVDRHELARMAVNLADRIVTEGGDLLGGNEQHLVQYQSRLDFLRTTTVPNLFNGNGAQAIPAYVVTLSFLERILQPALAIDSEKLNDDIRTAKSLTTKIRGLSVRVADLEPKADLLQEMASAIVEAHAAADQLPTDLISLRETREEIQSLLAMAAKDREEAARSLKEIKQHEESAKLRITQSERYHTEQVNAWNAVSEATKSSAEAIIARCEDAMRTSTSFGLSGAFHEQAKSLKTSILFWVVGLISALAAGAYFGGRQLHELSLAIEESTPPMIIWTRLFLSLLSVGAPVWFGWLATKQIGQRFRLAEDYAYKASISKAYEGYRREAVQLDPEFQIKLFSSALARLDEQPLRFVEHKSHGSPWHELLDSKVFKEALKIAPELVGKISDMAREKVEQASKKRNENMKKSEAEPLSTEAEGRQ